MGRASLNWKKDLMENEFTRINFGSIWGKYSDMSLVNSILKVTDLWPKYGITKYAGFLGAVRTGSCGSLLEEMNLVKMD